MDIDAYKVNRWVMETARQQKHANRSIIFLFKIPTPSFKQYPVFPTRASNPSSDIWTEIVFIRWTTFKKELEHVTRQLFA